MQNLMFSWVNSLTKTASKWQWHFIQTQISSMNFWAIFSYQRWQAKKGFVLQWYCVPTNPLMCLLPCNWSNMISFRRQNLTKYQNILWAKLNNNDYDNDRFYIPQIWIFVVTHCGVKFDLFLCQRPYKKRLKAKVIFRPHRK